MTPKKRVAPILFVVALVVCLVTVVLHVHIEATPSCVLCGGTHSAATALLDGAPAPPVPADGQALLSALRRCPARTLHGSAITRRGPPA